MLEAVMSLCQLSAAKMLSLPCTNCTVHPVTFIAMNRSKLFWQYISFQDSTVNKNGHLTRIAKAFEHPFFLPFELLTENITACISFSHSTGKGDSKWSLCHPTQNNHPNHLQGAQHWYLHNQGTRQPKQIIIPKILLQLWALQLRSARHWHFGIGSGMWVSSSAWLASSMLQISCLIEARDASLPI